MLKTNLQILEEVREFLDDSLLNIEKHVTKKRAFTKAKKLSFLRVVLFILQLPKRSLSVELEDFYDMINPTEIACTKSAFSQARYKVKEDFFEQWNKSLVKSYYTNNEERVKLWNGFQLHGIDGTTIYLSDHEELRTRFGEQSNQYGSVPMARVIGRYDLLNHILIDTKIDSINKSENTLTIQQLNQVSDNVLSIYDRNFASFEVIYEHAQRNLSFLIRCKLTANNVVKDFVKRKEATAIVKLPATETAIASLKKRGIALTKENTVTVRLVKVMLENGELEILITSLLDEEKYPCEIFGDLYYKRWGSEICFDILKNKLQVTLFSGQKPEAIVQEFHATIFNCNLNSLLIKDCEEEEKEVSKKRSHTYQINKNVSIGIMMKQVVRLFTVPQNEMAVIKKALIAKFIRYMEPVRTGRSFVRKFKKTTRRSKFFTLTNYARAF